MGERRPNIVLIVSDDLGYEAVGANGGTSYKTPVIDRMAANGIRFENAHVMPLCTPTRVQLMTGKYNFRNYIGMGLMDSDEVTFGHLFSDAGYKTLISGKWQMYSYDTQDEFSGDRNRGQRIEDAGFDEYCVWHAHHNEDKGSRYKDPVIYENGEYLEDTADKYGDYIFADRILNFMDRNKDEEFFVYYPMALTHGPFEPTPDSPEWEGYEPWDNKMFGATTRAEMLAGVESSPGFFKDMVEYHDKVIGRVNDKLDELGIREDTVVIYVGDNGTTQGLCSIMHDHREVCGGKGLTNDRGTHVPLIVEWPGTIAAGSVEKSMVDSSDFLPTILEIAGIDPGVDYEMDGRSFLPQLEGKTGNPRDWMYFHFAPKNWLFIIDTRFIRGTRWKLYDNGNLFDLEDDPDEEYPILPTRDNGEQAEARAQLEPIFAQMVPEIPPVK